MFVGGVVVGAGEFGTAVAELTEDVPPSHATNIKTNRGKIKRASLSLALLLICIIYQRR